MSSSKEKLHWIILRNDIPEVMTHREEINGKLSSAGMSVVKRGFARASTFRLAEIDWFVSQRIRSRKHGDKLGRRLSSQILKFVAQLAPPRKGELKCGLSVEYYHPGHFRVSMLRHPFHEV